MHAYPHAAVICSVSQALSQRRHTNSGPLVRVADPGWQVRMLGTTSSAKYVAATNAVLAKGTAKRAPRLAAGRAAMRRHHRAQGPGLPRQLNALKFTPP